MREGKLIGKIFGIALVFVMIGAMLGGLPSIAKAADKFNIGDTVEVYNTGGSGLLVRDAPCGNVIGGKFDGDRGVILDGPVYCSNYNRWFIRWSDGLEGWSAEDWLKEVYPSAVTAAIDNQLLDLIDQYASSYYKNDWNLNINQYKAWLATIAWAEGGLGGYGAHSQYGGGYSGDAFDHIVVGRSFRFSTGIGPFQLDRGQTENWQLWKTGQKLDPQLAVESVARWHRDNCGSVSTLGVFASNSPWVAVRTPADYWSAVTGTSWNVHSGGSANLDWPAIKSQLASRATNYHHLSYSNNVMDVGYLTWNIKAEENLMTDSGRPVIFDGNYQTLLVTARSWSGSQVCRYYYAYRADGLYPIEAWVWDNNWDTNNKFKYVFARECNGPFPEGRVGSSAGYPALSQPAILTGSDSPPSCSIQLLDKDSGSQITQVAVNRAFHVYVIASDDFGITQVRFSSDDSQDGNPIGSWTEWLSWGTSLSHWTGYWDATSKKKEWTFTTTGSKEVWAEVKDTSGQTKAGKANIHCSSNNPPQLSNGHVNPSSGTPSTNFYYYVTYYDADGDSPSVRQVYIDGTAYTMSLYSGSASNGVYRYGPKNLSAGGTHYYFFYFEDGKGGTVRLPSGIDMYLGPTVTPETYPPTVTTEGASSITTSSAALTGNLDSTGGETCQVWFEYGITTSYGISTSKLTMSSTGPFGAVISGLNPDTTYHFRACAQNSKGTSYGSDMTFKTEPTAQVVTFPDPNLEAAIREAIGKPTGDIYQSDLEGLIELDASGRGISNLSGLEYCINLEYLALTNNQMSDISPISNLASLTQLHLQSNQISDISPLSNLANLWQLGLGSNQISNLQPLSSLTNLSYLYLDNNQISNISPLSNLINLKLLGLSRNHITDIALISGLINVESLDLQHNEISEISPLHRLINLRSLWLSNNQINEIGALSELIKITILLLDDNEICDIAPLSGLTKLGESELYHNREGVKVHLGLCNNQISDIQPLVDNQGLNEEDGIDLRGNPLSADSLSTYIPQLEARGVNVLYDARRTWYVDDDLVDYPAADFTKIQDAVNAASPGDTIIVYPGTYTENVNVNKDHLTIQSENGAGSTIVQAPDGNNHMFEIHADYVEINGLTVKGAPGYSSLFTYGVGGQAGICLNEAHYCSVYGDVLVNSDLGVLMVSSSNNVIRSCHLSGEGDVYGGGIYATGSTGNNIIEDNFVESFWQALWFHGSDGNLIKGNTITNTSFNIYWDGPPINNICFLNNFMASYPAAHLSIPNFWNTPQKVTYVYEGNTYTNYLGNYWLYGGTDANNDGIRDAPYLFYGIWDTPQTVDQDNYPLVEPFENYEIGAGPKTWYVDDDLVDYPAADFTKIQDAVDAASPGDEIIVYPGTYAENVDVNKDHLTIQSENGADSTIVQATSGDVFAVSADYVTISGFTVKGARQGQTYAYADIQLKETHYCNITNNDCLNNYYGIVLGSSQDNRIENNICDNNGFGIFLSSSTNNNIMNNDCSKNTCGIQLDSSSNNNKVTNNTCNLNYGSEGISLAHHSDSNIVRNNECNSNGFGGIYLYYSNSNTITKNSCSDNPSVGIDFMGSLNNCIVNNNIKGSYYGIRLLDSSSGNIIFLNNFIDNHNNADSEDSTNTWDSIERITYTYNGNSYTSFLGNYWDDHTGSDADGDGIGEAPYPIDSDADNYPLMMPFENYGVGPAPYPVITSSLEITPEKDEYYVGDTLTAEFTITNRGMESVTFDVLTVGGRLNGGCPSEGCPDFTHQAVTIQPDESYQYDGSLALTQAGEYHFFCAYHTEEYILGEDENNWNTNIDIEVDGHIIEDFNEARRYREKDISVLEEAYIEPALGPASWEKLSGPWEEETDPYGDFSALLRKSIAINPNNPEIVYVGSDKGSGLYKSVDGGDNWQEINNGLPHLSWPTSSKYWPVAAITIAPSNPDIVYVGTTDINPYYSWVPHGMGIYKSINGGSSWTPANGVNGEQFPKYPVSSMIVDPTNADVVYVGTVGGGIWKTPDGGDNWQHIWSPIGELCFDVNAIAISLANPAIIYVAVYNYVPLSGSIPSGIVFQGGLYKSETGGDTWEKIWGERVDDIVIDNKDASTLCTVICGYRVCKSVDGGTNWDDISGTSGEDPLPNPSYDSPIRIGSVYSLTMDPDFTNVIYTANKWDCDAGGIYLSPNSGENWFPIGLQDERVEKITLASDSDYHALYAVTTDGLFKLDFSNSAIIVQKYSPVELRVYDSQEQVTGLVEGEVKSEIPKSVYYNGTIIIFSSTDSYYYELVGTAAGSYGLGVISVVDGEITTFKAIDIPTIGNAMHNYTIDWDALAAGEAGVNIKIDSDGDGEFEETIVTSQPNTPSSPSPANHATGVSVDGGLSWTGGDPDAGENVTYSIYFGTNSTPPFRETIGPYAANQTFLSYDPGTLACNATYYWKIVARDNHGITREGPIWTFTTEPCPVLELCEGVNIISYTGATTSLPEALTNIGPDGLDVVEIVWTRGYWTGGQWLNFYFYHGFPLGEITELENGRAYVVVVTEACTWELPSLT